MTNQGNMLFLSMQVEDPASMSVIDKM